ncbi:MAG: tetratricopeptide repeat protein, partial [Candidatus Eremiobacteraeota bacterium]|nr:tetratricopeptide repeat protein [Candidatus Eremiobacteraeota bacterium]
PWVICISLVLTLVQNGWAQSYAEDKARADKALGSGDYATAISSFQKLVADYPDQVEGFNALGFAYYLNGQFDDAIATFETALSKDPSDDSAKRNLILAGGRRALESSYRSGLERIQELKQRFPGHPQLAVLDFYTGKLHYLYGFAGPAFDAWQKVARARPDSGTALFMKAVEARANRDAAAQNRYYQEALSKMPQEEVFRLWGARGLIEAGNAEEAAVLTTGISERPTLTPGVAIAIARFERMRGRTLQAFEQLKKTESVPEVMLERALMTSQLGASPDSVKRDVQQALDAGGEGAVILLSDEPGARVYVDGTLLGSPPLGLFPSPGQHEVRVVYDPSPVLVSRFLAPSSGMLVVQTGTRTGVESKAVPSRSEFLP